MSIKFTIEGEPASKANTRKLAINWKTKKPMFIKSEKARNYERDFKLQCRKISPLIEGDVRVNLKIYYASRRPDVDESIILDSMQGLIYVNDRQVRMKFVDGTEIDKKRPRTEIEVVPLDV